MSRVSCPVFMNYKQSLKYLDSFINYEKIYYHSGNRLFNLDRMKCLLDGFGHPEKSFFPVLIAGTKGKGSTGYFLESILREARVPVGFYSSPHLEECRERIRLQGKMISKDGWVKVLQRLRSRLVRFKLALSLGTITYFEVMTLAAILTFKEAAVKIGIFEVGMGGRLDATNAMDARIALLTAMDLDHEAFLGRTVGKIAREKAQIIKRGAYVVTGAQRPAAMRQIREQVRKKRATLVKIQPVKHLKTGLAGDFQKDNAAIAYHAALILKNIFGFRISGKSLKRGLRKRAWPGRLERICAQPDIVLDSAHNPASVDALVRNLKKLYRPRNRVLIFGVSREKRSEKMLKSLSRYFPEVILTPTTSVRSQEVTALTAQARNYFSRTLPARNIREALCLARSRARRGDLVTATGSFYLIGELRRLLKG